MLFLLEPSLAFRDEFLEIAAEFQSIGLDYGHHRLAQGDFQAYLDEVQRYAQGIDLPPGHVPMDTYWLAQAGRLLGESRLRHWLTPALELEGGHIGYAIRPAQWRRGYGTHILALTLEKARERGLRRVLVTCDKDNTASARIIEKNGGRLAGEALSEGSGKPVLRYWIESGNEPPDKANG